MQKLNADRPWPLFDVAATRQIERQAAAALPAHALMQRAGLATARLALAIAPHARTIWVACGAGNNGGDGLEAAAHLHRWGKSVHVTLAVAPDALPPDAAAAWRTCAASGVVLSTEVPPTWDLCIDALLGIGAARPLQGALAALAQVIDAGAGTVLSVDVPSGLAADTGTGDSVRATHTLSLLTLKPGLFTALGRDAAGEVWFDDLGIDAPAQHACALLAGLPTAAIRAHASHKGTHGDVAIVGGAMGMTGAAVLAGSAALHAGAGRVYLGLLDPSPAACSAAQPELMVPDWTTLPLDEMAIAAGCGGGTEIAAVLPRLLARARSLVLDADGLNAVAADSSLQQLLRSRALRGHPTVLTPHPLEAARLLAVSTADIQGDRLRSARTLAERFGCVVVLKGSGSVVAQPGRLPSINPTGNARLATAGTGDVLAGLVAAGLAAGQGAFEAAASAVYRHGLLADRWPPGEPLTAGALAARATP